MVGIGKFDLGCARIDRKYIARLCPQNCYIRRNGASDIFESYGAFAVIVLCITVFVFCTVFVLTFTEAAGVDSLPYR